MPDSLHRSRDPHCPPSSPAEQTSVTVSGLQSGSVGEPPQFGSSRTLRPSRTGPEPQRRSSSSWRKRRSLKRRVRCRRKLDPLMLNRVPVLGRCSESSHIHTRTHTRRHTSTNSQLRKTVAHGTGGKRMSCDRAAGQLIKTERPPRRHRSQIDAARTSLDGRCGVSLGLWPPSRR